MIRMLPREDRADTFQRFFSVLPCCREEVSGGELAEIKSIKFLCDSAKGPK